jgi:hypothetical protein
MHLLRQWLTRTADLLRIPSLLNREQSILRCRQSVRLTTQHTIHLIELRNREILVVCHPAGTTLLSTGTMLQLEKEAHVQPRSAA